MKLYSEDFYQIEAPPAIEINVRPNILYTEEYSYLTKDELEVLFLLATTEMFADGFTSFSFSGIKRQLGKHQQKITKAINRLVSKSLLIKNEMGYSLSQKGTTILSHIISLNNAVDLSKSSDKFLEQRIVFKEKISLEKVAVQLIGKWFGSFRYISHTEGNQLIVRWQLVDSRASATLRIFPTEEAILSLIPDNGSKQKYAYEKTLEDLSQYLLELLQSLGAQPKIISQEWKDSTISSIEYQQRLTTWLNAYNKQNLPEN